MTQTQQHNAPTLRFPEFSGEWATKTLDELCGIQAGNFVKASDISQCKAEGLFRCYGGNGLRGYVSGFNREGRFPLIGRQGALCGNVHFVEGKFHATEHALVADAREGEMADWLFYLLGQMKLNQYSTGLAQPGISAEIIKKIRAKAPTLPEQQKIASFLSSVDRKIAQLGEKKALLQAYKKGMMQKLFSGQLRFKDAQGNDFPDWEEKRLGDVLKESRIKGSTGEVAKKITVKLWGRGVFYKDTKGSPNTQYYKRKKGQFIYSKLDFLNCAFGVVPKELDGFESTVDLPCFDVLNGISAKFLLERILQKNFYKRLGDIADGSRKAKRIHADTFLDFNLHLPSPKEQQKIATFLSAIDRKIDLVTTELDHAKAFKKGLLQQMFV